MKNTFKTTTLLFSIIFLFVSTFVSAQTVTLYTPNGSTVEAHMRDEMSIQDITYYTNSYRDSYPQAEVLANASNTYNCHSYAWNLSEGGTTVCWLNQIPDLHKYWDDYSYLETTESNTEKIFYYNGDHSAVKSKTVAGKYESKWGAMPLMRHDPTYGPSFYNMTYRKYYIKITALPTISGPSQICTSNCTFTVNNPYSGSTISWSVASGQLQKVSSSGNTAVFRGSTAASGPGLIQATVTTPFGTVLNATYLVWVGVPSVSNISGPRYNQVGAYASYYATITDIRANVTSFNWTLIPGTFNNYFNPGGDHCYITWYRAGEYVLQVNATNTCGTSSSYNYPISVGSKSYLSVSPNPASDNVQVSIMKTQNTSSISDTTSITSKLVTISSQDLVTTYTIKIYNPFGTLLYSTKKTGDTFTIPVNNLKNGTYIIEANDGKQSFSQQLIIEH